MPLSPDLAVIVKELIDADLAWVAAEIIGAIELPQPLNVTSGDVVDHPQLAPFQPGLEDRWSTLRSAKTETQPENVGIPELDEAQQMSVAINVIELLLLEPAVRFAEAERIAGRIQSVGVVGDRKPSIEDPRSPEPVRFAFRGREDTGDIDPFGLRTVADLDRLLREISGRPADAPAREEGHDHHE